MRENADRPLTAARNAAPVDDHRPGVRLGGANREALDLLLPGLYAELRRIARRELRREQPGHTLDSGALVHEAYLKLAGQPGIVPRDRSQLLAAAARSMRTILIDYARARAAAKRGGGGQRLSLQDSLTVDAFASFEELLALDEALDRLARIDEQASLVVEQRYFAGMTVPEIAAVLNLSVATIERRWAFAKAWLRLQLGDPV
jgi:RNA polymerase sigma-70 factor, ECF subfamily